MTMMMLALMLVCRSTPSEALRRTAFASSRIQKSLRVSRRDGWTTSSSRLFSVDDESTASSTTTSSTTTADSEVPIKPRVAPWAAPDVKERVYKKRRQNKTRFRQHVNPLARQYQQPTPLPEQWPATVYEQPALPLHLDIGCSKGGFLIDLCQHETQNRSLPAQYNYMGLEIRPMVAEFAQSRIPIHNLTGILEFVGCNANVDLERILTLYQGMAKEESTAGDDSTATAASPSFLHRVTIQFPDPHFKNAHAKRRVVRDELVDTLARFMPPEGLVFLQSDVQPVLDSMRQVFGNCTHYFRDAYLNDYTTMPDNILGVPTEREMSVIQRDLPVYRSIFYRTETLWDPSTSEAFLSANKEEEEQENYEDDDGENNDETTRTEDSPSS